MQPKTLKVELDAKPKFKTNAKSVCKCLGTLSHSKLQCSYIFSGPQDDHSFWVVCGYLRMLFFILHKVKAGIIELVGADLKRVFRAVTYMLFANADGVVL